MAEVEIMPVHIDYAVKNKRCDTLVWQIADNTSWETFKLLLRLTFECNDNDNLTVTYIDNEYDVVTIGSDAEFREAFEVAKRYSNRFLYIRVRNGAEHRQSCDVPVEETTQNEKAIDHTDTGSFEPFDARKTYCFDTCNPDHFPRADGDDGQKPKTIPEAERPDLEVVFEDDVTVHNPNTEAAENASVPEQHDTPDKATVNTLLVLAEKAYHRETKGKAAGSSAHQEMAERDACTGEKIVKKKKWKTGNEPPPKWFTSYMGNFKNEVIDEVSKKTAKKILKRSAPNDQACHAGVICDSCDKLIYGIRYKCGNCKNYDLCMVCEEDGKLHHDDTHVFLKIRRPVTGIIRKLLAEVLYDGPAVAATNLPKQKSGKCEKKEKHLKEKKHKSKKHTMEEIAPGCVVGVNLPGSAHRVSMDAFKYTLKSFCDTKCLDSKLVRDERISNSDQVEVGATFQMNWYMENTGKEAWTVDTKLNWLWGSLQTTNVTIPHLRPGHSGKISADIVAPQTPGRYSSHWQLNEHGLNFGHLIWCEVQVVGRDDFEVLQIVEQPQPAAPNNTPMVLSPPKSPVLATALNLSRLSLVPMTASNDGESSNEENESVSSDGDASFIMVDVPMPPCFNTDIPINVPEPKQCGIVVVDLEGDPKKSNVQKEVLLNIEEECDVEPTQCVSTVIGKVQNSVPNGEAVTSNDSPAYDPTNFEDAIEEFSDVSADVVALGSGEVFHDCRGEEGVQVEEQSEGSSDHAYEFVMVEGRSDEVQQKEGGQNNCQENLQEAFPNVCQEQQALPKETAIPLPPPPSSLPPVIALPPPPGCIPVIALPPPPPPQDPTPSQEEQDVVQNENAEGETESAEQEQQDLQGNVLVNHVSHIAYAAANAANAASSAINNFLQRLEPPPQPPPMPNLTSPPETPQWAPPQPNQWVPPQWTPPQPPLWAPPQESSEPMQVLFNMGFCNRDVNEGLLREHNNDIGRVIADILDSVDNDWYTQRH